MSHKIDNDKMWASLIKNWVEAYSIDRSTVNTVFDKALEEQGLKLNGDFEIVEIDPQIRDAVEDNFYSMLDDSAVWEPKEGDRVRLKGATNPIYHLCSKDEYGYFSFVQEMENGIAGGNIHESTLKRDYELVDSYDERLSDVEKCFDVLKKSINGDELSDLERKLYDLIIKANNCIIRDNNYYNNLKNFVKEHSHEFNVW